MTRDNFIELMDLAESLIRESDRWVDFGIDIFEMPIYTIPWDMFEVCIKDNFNSDGIDWIHWYLWERRSINTNDVLPCFDEDGKEFYVNTASDLWDLVKENLLGPTLDIPCTSKCNPCTNS